MMEVYQDPVCSDLKKINVTVKFRGLKLLFLRVKLHSWKMTLKSQTFTSLLDWIGRVAAELGATLLCCVSAPNCRKTTTTTDLDLNQINSNQFYLASLNNILQHVAFRGCERTRPTLLRSNRLNGRAETASVWMKFFRTSEDVVWM